MSMEQQEDQIWKTVYNRLTSQKSEEHTAHELRIQEVDGGFFEKFGAIFREHAEQVQDEELAEQKRVADVASGIELQIADAAEGECEAVPRVDSDSDAENSTSSSDSEPEDQKDKTDFISVAWNIDELYCDILYEIIHNVGCDVTCEIGQTALLSYAQDAFKVSTEKHRELLEIAEKKEPPEILLNVEVIEAKDLKAKDSNGLSDPFVTLYLTSNSSHRYNTSVKQATLTPIWEEHFALPIADHNIEDSLCLEVWDFDPAETVKEKLGKIFAVKGVKGMRKLMKEIAVTAATGQHENELIGKAQVPLSTIPASGLTMWYSLDKKNKTSRQGVLKVRISFSSESVSQVAEQKHRNLLRILLLHELETSKVAPFWWCGNFSPQGEALLTQNIAQSGLSPVQVAACQWSAYAAIHQNHHLSFTLFSSLLDKLLRPIQTGGLSEEDIRVFWDATKKILPSCFSVIRKIRKKCANEKATIKQLTQVLNILSKLSQLEPPLNMDLFPVNLYPWTTFNDNGPNCDITMTLNDAVCQGASDWFNHLIENNNRPTNGKEINKIQYLIQIIQLVRSDLQKAIEFYDKLFQKTVNFQYARCLYTYYQAQISAMVEPDVTEFCKGLKKLQFTGYTLGEASVEILSEGTSLFELYLAVQRFVMLGNGLCPIDCDTFHIKNFHRWFHGGVAQWLDIAVYKALQRIEKAVELDTLVPVDATVKYSSSAVDTLTIFYQVKVFWQQLNWPDVEGCYTFIAKIIDDICRCCVFYASIMAKRVDGMGDTENIYEKKFEVTNEWCLAINNIDYMRQSLKPFTEELGMSDVIDKLADLRSPLEAQRCQQTLDNVIANAIDTVRNEIIDLLEVVISKMAPAMKRLLIEGAELFDQDSNSIDRLMRYVDTNLATLHRELNEENFSRILEILWDVLNKILQELIQSNLEKRRPPSFFANLHKTLNVMVGSFKDPDDNSNCDDLRTTEKLLRLNGLETADLIHEVNLELYKQFSEIRNSPYGELTVRVKFEGPKLHIEIMNARNLMAMDSNGAADSFVRVHFLPEHEFVGITKPKTQTHNKTLFPLYDEQFTVNLTPQQKELKNGLLLFSCKDKDLLGYNNQYIGEAFIHFKDIPETTDPLSSLPQVHLQLGRPTSLNTDALKALEYRQGDKQAKEFIRRFKQRMGNP